LVFINIAEEHFDSLLKRKDMLAVSLVQAHPDPWRTARGVVPTGDVAPDRNAGLDGDDPILGARLEKLERSPGHRPI
jgi:hypothetical protein